MNKNNIAEDIAHYCHKKQMQGKMFKYTGFHVTFL